MTNEYVCVCVQRNEQIQKPVICDSGWRLHGAMRYVLPPFPTRLQATFEQARA